MRTFPESRWRVLLKILFGVLMAAGSAAAQESGAATRPAFGERPNVLFISTDDLNIDLGCYGRPWARTPNLDRLAEQGVRFDLTYCQYPLCNPSRVSMLTGLRPDTTRVYDLATNFRTTVPDAVTLPQLFRQNGYYTARVGKIFHYGVPRQIGTPGMDDPISWDFTFNPLGRDKIEEDRLHILTRGTGTNTIGFAMAWLSMDGTDEEQTDGIGVAQTVRLLEEVARERRPFFIGMGFYRPHTPFVATHRWFDAHPLESVKLHTRPADDLDDVPDIALHIRPPDYGLDEGGLRDCMRGYRAAVSCLDAQVGILLDTLDRLGLAENTIVVFFSDNGFLLGQHGQWQKQLLFDESARVPLIIRVPGMGGKGPCLRPVELLDVYPTLVELCRLPAPPQQLEGRSLVPFLRDPATPSDRPAFSQVTRNVGRGEQRRRIMGYSVRTQRWRYTEWGPDGRRGRELYDHETDPGEFRNLAEDPAHRETVEQLRGLLQQVRRYRPAT